MPDPSDGAGEERRYQLRPRRRFARRLVRSLLVLAVLTGLHHGWGDRSEARFEREVAALAAAGEPVSLAAMATPPVPDGLNGTLEVRLAAKWAKGQDVVIPFMPGFITRGTLPLTAIERERLGALVATQRDVLDTVRSARAKGGVDWQIPLRSPEWVDQAYQLDGLADVFTLLRYAVLYEHDVGNDSAALEDVRSMLFVGRSLTVRPFPFSQRSGNSVASVAASRLAEIAADLEVATPSVGGSSAGAAQAAQIREVIAELLDDAPWRQGVRRALAGERARLVQSVRGLAQGRVRLSELEQRFGACPSDDPVARVAKPVIDASFGSVLRPKVYDDGVMLVRHLGVVINAFDDSADWPTANERVPWLPAGMGGDWTPVTHTAACALYPGCDWDTRDFYDAAASRRLAAAALAVRWYACEHGGNLPARLQDLLPDYLPALPLDPLAAGGRPLSYRNDSKRPIVYSVGGDGRDDGGCEDDPDVSPRPVSTDEVRHLRRQPRRILQWTTVEPGPKASG